MDTVKGFIEHIIFRNAENGYTVLNLVDGEDEITCVGIFQTADQGETIEAQGEYITHAVYGEQFKIERYKIVPPDDAAGIERYLGSGAVKGVGAALAARIVKKFGADTYRIIEEEPERLAEIKGISDRKAREIAAALYEKRDAREAMSFLQKYGISNTLAFRIYEAYGARVYGILKENPYQLAEDVHGIGFKIADEIAAKIGIHTDSDFRIRSGLLYTLMLAAAEGHCYLPQSILLKKAGELLGLEPALMEPQLGNLAMDKKLVMKMPAPGEEECRVYASTYYYAELNCARMLHDLNVRAEEEQFLPAQEQGIGEKIDRLAQELEIELDALQKKSVLESVRNGIFILSGGPGTGKTTTINVIIRYFLAEGMDIYLAAPTGRAAKRMTEATGYESRTIHRMLELSGEVSGESRAARFERNEGNPLEADVIIVDEMSMVDIFLFQALLKAVTVGTRLIMVGDVNQLPSVGPGQVLQDIMNSGRFPTVVLEKIFRQAGESDIVWNAHRIHAGQEPALDNKSRDFFCLEKMDSHSVLEVMLWLVRDKMPKYTDCTAFDVQVLTPMKKGELGVVRCNEVLQKYLNPEDGKKAQLEVHGTVFREGDKVMQVKNNYQLPWRVEGFHGVVVEEGTGVFNGDCGIIEQIDLFNKEMTVAFDEGRLVKYSFGDIDELELAYAVTIHKSQGSEYPAVVIPLLGGPRVLMNRNLLYTAVTRGKKCVTIVGSKKTVSDMICNESEQKRYSTLEIRLKELQNN